MNGRTMTTDFERAHEFTAAWEGGFVDHPLDKGGPTNLGVTQRVWEAWCRENRLYVKPMRALTMKDVLPLYRAKYWEVLAAKLPWPLSAAIYDMSVNHGPGDGNPSDEGGNEAGATWMLYRARQIAPDGTPLQQALAACDARQQFYEGIVRRNPSQKVFWNGWMRRLNAQRAWLKVNAQPLSSFHAEAKVILINPAGAEVIWNGKPDPYGGTTLSDALISQLRLLFPQPGGPWNYEKLRVWVRRNGDLVLDKTPA